MAVVVDLYRSLMHQHYRNTIMIQPNQDFLQFVSSLKQDPEKILEGISNNKTDLWHMVTGLIGEVGEVYQVVLEIFKEKNKEDHSEEALAELSTLLEKEIGDVFFYIYGVMDNPLIGKIEYDEEGLSQLKGHYMIAGEYNFDSLPYVCLNLFLNASKIAEWVKKIVVSDKDVYHEIRHEIRCMLIVLQVFCDMVNLPEQQCISAVTKKLKVRFPSGEYNIEQAKNKEDEA